MTTRVDQLENEYRRADVEIMALHKRQREISSEIDRINLANRPTYPTEAQRDGIVEAVRKISEGQKSSSHHGDPAVKDDRSVLVDGARCWLSVNHGAPYRHRGPGKLWAYTDEEVSTIIHLVADCGWKPLDWWRHENGVSLVVAPK